MNNGSVNRRTETYLMAPSEKARMTNFESLRILSSIFLLSFWATEVCSKDIDYSSSKEPESYDFCEQSRILAPWEIDVNIHMSGFPKSRASRFEYIARRVAKDFPHKLSFSADEKANLVVFQLDENQLLPARAANILKIMYPDDPEERAKSLSNGNGVVDYTLTLGVNESGIAIGGFGVLRSTFSKVEFESRSSDLMAILLGVQVRESALLGKSGDERLRAIQRAVGAAYVCADISKPN